jgi:TPP-dependent pyruvate/acetoin dehydrogenase alpha subunit
MKPAWDVTYSAVIEDFVLTVEGELGTDDWTWSVHRQPDDKLVAGAESKSAAAAMRSAEQAAKARVEGDRSFVAPHPDRKDGCRCPVIGGQIPHRLGCRWYGRERRTRPLSKRLHGR